MRESRKTFIFFVSLFITLAFTSILSRILYPVIINSSKDLINNIIYPLFLTVAFLFFTLFQAFYRYHQSKGLIKRNTVFFTVNADKFKFNEKILFYVILALIYFGSILRNSSFNTLMVIRIILFMASIALFEFLVRYSNKSIKIHFLKDGIIVSGFDIRLDLPVVFGANIRNDSGYYRYTDFDGYLLFPDHIELFLILERGKLIFNTDSELTRQVTGILSQNKIGIKKNI